MRKGTLRTPSLNALRVFEATARHLSFTRAAAELHITQAAVSRQVRELEATLGCSLFVRLHRQVELTPQGAQLARDLTQSFAAIERSLESLRGRKREAIRVSVDPAFAACWLMRRLPAFLAAHPDIDVEIESTELIREVGREADAAIRYLSASREERASATLLREVQIFPVLTPRLADGGLRAPRDLLRYPLLHEDDGSYWHRWFAEAGVNDEEPVLRRIRLNDVALVLQAAVDGAGVALGDDLLAGDALRAGRLIRPFALSLPCGGYWYIQPRGEQMSAQRCLGDWLKKTLADESVAS